MRVLIDLLRWVYRRVSGRRLRLAVYVEDPPSALSGRAVYLVGMRDRPWLAMTQCPCGCGEAIQLSLMDDDRPRWTASVSTTGRVTLRPSINRTRGCRSHFFVRSGRIEWAGARGERDGARLETPV